MPSPSLKDAIPGAVVAALFAFVLLLVVGKPAGSAAITAAIVAVVAVPSVHLGRVAAYRKVARGPRRKR